MSARIEQLLAEILLELRDQSQRLSHALSDVAQVMKSSGARKRANTERVYTLDTSTTVEKRLDFVKDLGVPAMNILLVDAGGGVTFRSNNGDAYAAPTGLSINDEEITVAYWKGTGAAGTATLRVSGRVE